MGYPSGFVGQFLEYGKNIGFARSNRFVVFVHGPGITKPLIGYEFSRNGIVSHTQSISIDQKLRLALTCQAAEFPMKSVMTQEFNPVGNGPNTHHAVAENVSGDLTLEFLTSSDFFERIYFESWVDKVVNPGTHEVGVYSHYAAPWNIIVAHLPLDLNEYGNGADANSVAYHLNNSYTALSQIYFVKFHQVYPVRVNNQSLQQNNQGSPLTLNVTFKYNRWSDPIVDYQREQDFVRQQLINAKEGNVSPNITKVNSNNPIDDRLDPNGVLDKTSPFEYLGTLARAVGSLPPFSPLYGAYDTIRNGTNLLKDQITLLQSAAGARLGDPLRNVGRSSIG